MLTYLLALSPHGRSLTPGHIIALVILIVCALRIMSLLTPAGRRIGSPMMSVILMMFVIPFAIIALIN